MRCQPEGGEEIRHGCDVDEGDVAGDADAGDPDRFVGPGCGHPGEERMVGLVAG